MNSNTLDFNKNEDVMRQVLSQLKTRLDKISLGGGKKAIEKQKEKNKLTPRERMVFDWCHGHRRHAGGRPPTGRS